MPLLSLRQLFAWAAGNCRRAAINYGNSQRVERCEWVRDILSVLMTHIYVSAAVDIYR